MAIPPHACLPSLLLLALSVALASAPAALGLASNAGLYPPNYSVDDLVNTDAPVAVPRVVGSLGVASYVVFSSMAVAETQLGLAQIAPCTTLLPHTHPRGNEHVGILKGSIIGGVIFENNTMANWTLYPEQYVVFPQGLTHWEVNPSCESAQLMITFSAANPGTILTNVNLAAMPSDLQTRLFGKLAANATYVGVDGVVGWWPEDPVCVARCQAAAANRRAKF